MPRIVRPGGRQHRLELATQRQTAELTLSELINRLLPQRTPVRHRRSNRRRLSGLTTKSPERLRRPAFRGRCPRRFTTASASQIAAQRPQAS
jgi:hypothetical protein